jgi:serine/threonine protein kinase/Tfp pilus assembly protein PilF
MAPLSLERLRTALSQLYTIDRELGRGGMATVYLAQDCKHERLVALKVLHPELAASLGPDRFLREIKTAARLNHPHILPLHDSGEADGFLYYVMPYVEGESLRERLEREEFLSVEETVGLTRGIASALDYAHRHGIIHRDIKPENLMLYEGEAMVADFGIAKAVSAAGSETLTQTGMMVGTPAYVSPEQAAGETNLDGRSDQYSLACVVYEMLSGQRPFTGATPQSILAKRFTEPVKPIRSVRSTIPENVEKALSKAMSTEADGRYRTAGLFAQALASTSLTTPTDTATMPQPVVSSAKSIAVLPFTNMSADAENEYFTDGMAEEIINALSKIQSLRVASRTASFAFKGKNEDIAEIGKKLKVSTFLEGSVRKMGSRLRITAQLVNVADGYHLWSERYDREMEDIFAIQDDISQAIVRALRVILSEGEKKQIEKARAVNVQAYDYYLRGRQYFHQLRRKSLEYARQMFSKAIEIDPEYARAYAGVADCYSLLYTYFDAREFNLRQADAASRKALELEPELAEAHVARGLAVSLSKKFDEAEKEFETAIRLDPQMYEATYWFGRARLSQGRFDEAVKLLERAAALRPEDYQTQHFLAQALDAQGKREEMLAVRRKEVKLLEQHLELNPEDPRACILGAVSYAMLDEIDQSVKLASRAMEIDPEDPMLLYNVACNYAVLGRLDDSLEALDRAVSKGWGDRAWIEHDKDLDPLRSNPRFQAIVEAM